MAKKDEIIEVEPPVEAPAPVEPPVVAPKAAPKKPVNIMDPKDSSEPPKRKAQDEAPAVDLSPVIDEIQKGFAALVPKSDAPPTAKKEEDFLAPLGNW